MSALILIESKGGTRKGAHSPYMGSLNPQGDDLNLQGCSEEDESCCGTLCVSPFLLLQIPAKLRTVAVRSARGVLKIQQDTE